MYFDRVFIIFKVLELTVHLHFLYSFIHFAQKHKKNASFSLLKAIPLFFRLALNAFPDIGSVGRFEKKFTTKSQGSSHRGFKKSTDAESNDKLVLFELEGRFA